MYTGIISNSIIEAHRKDLLHDVFGSLQCVSPDPDQCRVMHVSLILPVTIHSVPVYRRDHLEIEIFHFS